MTIAEYLEAVAQRLLADQIVSSFQIVRERATPIDGHLRARLVLSDGSRLEFSEYVQRTLDDRIQVVTYSYHWSNSEGALIRRWDNTPHYPRLAGFPHHVHNGSSGTLETGVPVNIFAVLDRITAELG